MKHVALFLLVWVALAIVVGLVIGAFIRTGSPSGD